MSRLLNLGLTMIYAVFATDAVRPDGWARFRPHKVRVGEVEATTAAEAEARAKVVYSDELAGKGIRVEVRR